LNLHFIRHIGRLVDDARLENHRLSDRLCSCIILFAANLQVRLPDYSIVYTQGLRKGVEARAQLHGTVEGNELSCHYGEK
jgi:hypothetical protein